MKRFRPMTALVVILSGIFVSHHTGDTWAGFTASAIVGGNAQALSVSQVLPLTLAPVKVVLPSKDKTSSAPSSASSVSIGQLSNTTSETLQPEISLNGPTGLALGSLGSLAGGSSVPLTLSGIDTLAPDTYSLTVSITVDGFTERQTTTLTVVMSKDKPAGKTPFKKPAS